MKIIIKIYYAYAWNFHGKCNHSACKHMAIKSALSIKGKIKKENISNQEKELGIKKEESTNITPWTCPISYKKRRWGKDSHPKAKLYINFINISSIYCPKALTVYLPVFMLYRFQQICIKDKINLWVNFITFRSVKSYYI